MKEEIENKLEKLSGYVEELESNSDVTVEELEEDRMKRAAIERFFQMSIETVLDVCSMVVSYEGLEKPDEYRKLILELGKAGILDKEFSGEFADVAGFRNILVHQYTEVKLELLRENLKTGLEDFDTFSRQIAGYLEGLEEE